MSNIGKTQPIHPPRQRMIEDMTLRGISQTSQSRYIRCVRNCCAHLKLAPGALTAEDVRGFLLHLQAEGVSVSGINSHSTALRFFLKVTLKRGEEVDRIPILRDHRHLPVVFTPEEVARIIACAPPGPGLPAAQGGRPGNLNRSAPIVGIGIRQGHPSPVIPPPDQRQAGDRRYRSLMQSDLEVIATRKNQLVQRSVCVSTNRDTTDFFDRIPRIYCFPS